MDNLAKNEKGQYLTTEEENLKCRIKYLEDQLAQAREVVKDVIDGGSCYCPTNTIAFKCSYCKAVAFLSNLSAEGTAPKVLPEGEGKMGIQLPNCTIVAKSKGDCVGKMDKSKGK